MKNVWDLTIDEINVLFKLADFEDYKITRLEKATDYGIIDCLVVFAESTWEDAEGDFAIEDEIVKLFPNRYEDICNFSRGFEISLDEYIQWALWCGLIEKINFNEIA